MSPIHTGDGRSFLDELELDKKLIEQSDRPILRVCYHFEPDFTGVIERCYVHASTKVTGELLSFSEHVGDLWGPGFGKQDLEVQARAEALYDRLVNQGLELGMQIRGLSFA